MYTMVRRKLVRLEIILMKKSKEEHGDIRCVVPSMNPIETY